jgi:hypothetical protein
MRTVTTFALAVLLAGLGAKEVFASGSDHPKERLAAQARNCVHGYWINQSDVFFYTGDAADFNKFAGDLAKKQGAKLQIVVHKGTKQARSLWDKADREIPVDWSVTTGPMAVGARVAGETDLVRIDLWLGGKVKKEAVKYPADSEIVSAGEFEKPKGDDAPGKK